MSVQCWYNLCNVYLVFLKQHGNIQQVSMLDFYSYKKIHCNKMFCYVIIAVKGNTKLDDKRQLNTNGKRFIGNTLENRSEKKY